MSFEDNFRKSLELTRKMLEEQYKDSPETVEKIMQTLDKNITNYTFKNDQNYPELSKQKI